MLESLECLRPFSSAIAENSVLGPHDLFSETLRGVVTISSWTLRVSTVETSKASSFIQIAARAHFLVVLTPGSLEQTTKTEDWLRREVEHAIKLERNFVPVMIGGFDFKNEAEQFPEGRFPGQLEQLRAFNGVNVPEDFFDDAMRKLRDRFLRTPTRVALTPAPQGELSEVKRKIEKTANLSPDQSILNRFGLMLSNFFLFTLGAPTLSSEWGSLKWTPVRGATEYVLESSGNKFFSEVHIVYRGDKTEFFYRSYNVFLRVKAENNDLNLESPWSNIIRL